MREEVTAVAIASLMAFLGLSMPEPAGAQAWDPEALTLEERARAITAAFQIRSATLRDSALPAPCGLYEALDESPRYRELLAGLADAEELPPPEAACEDGGTSGGMGSADVWWRLDGVGGRGDTIRVVGAVLRHDGRFRHSESIKLVPGPEDSGGYWWSVFDVGRVDHPPAVIDSGGTEKRP